MKGANFIQNAPCRVMLELEPLKLKWALIHTHALTRTHARTQHTLRYTHAKSDFQLGSGPFDNSTHVLYTLEF